MCHRELTVKSSMNEAFIQVTTGFVPHLSVIMDAGSWSIYFSLPLFQYPNPNSMMAIHLAHLVPGLSFILFSFQSVVSGFLGLFQRIFGKSFSSQLHRRQTEFSLVWNLNLNFPTFSFSRILFVSFKIYFARLAGRPRTLSLNLKSPNEMFSFVPVFVPAFWLVPMCNVLVIFTQIVYTHQTSTNKDKY